MKKSYALGLIVLMTAHSGAIANSFYAGPSLFIQNISASHSSSRSLHPKLSLGYGGMSGEYYLSGEVFVVPFTTPLSATTDTGAVNAKTTYGYGVSFIPGVMLNESILGFLRLGIVNSKFTGPNTSKNGAQLGIGLSTPITPRWDFRAEYIYTAYSSISGLSSAASNELGIGAIYKFDIT